MHIHYLAPKISFSLKQHCFVCVFLDLRFVANMADRYIREGVRTLIAVGKASMSQNHGCGGEPPRRPSQYSKAGSLHTATVPIVYRNRKVAFDDERYIGKVKRHQAIDEEQHGGGKTLIRIPPADGRIQIVPRRDREIGSVRAFIGNDWLSSRRMLKRSNIWLRIRFLQLNGDPYMTGWE